MENKIIDKIRSVLKSIILKNQTINLLDSKLINGLRFEENIIYFTLDLLPEQLKDSQEIKKTIEKKLLCIEGVEKTEMYAATRTPSRPQLTWPDHTHTHVQSTYKGAA